MRYTTTPTQDPFLGALTQSHDYDGGDRIPYGEAVGHRSVTIGDNVWIGSRVTLPPGTTLADGCIVQAGSVVSGNILYRAIAGSNPAVVLKFRDVAHYEKLRDERKFL